MELTKIRQEIDRLDAELVKLLCERLDYSRKSAAYKKENGLDIFHEDREREVLEAVTAAAEALDKDGYGYGIANRLIYSTVVEVSRSLQYKTLGGGQALRNILEAAPIKWADEAQIVCCGVRGTFADEAARAIFPNAEPRFITRRSEVIDAVKSGEADYGVLPVREPFYGVLDFAAENGCYIVARIHVQVDNIVKGNVTEFVVISRTLHSMPDANHTTLRFYLPHNTGALYHTLGRFALEGLNLTKLHSRPIENADYDCAFYLDFDGNLKNPRTADLLCVLSEELGEVVLFGNYREYVI